MRFVFVFFQFPFFYRFNFGFIDPPTPILLIMMIVQICPHLLILLFIIIIFIYGLITHALTKWLFLLYFHGRASYWYHISSIIIIITVLCTCLRAGFTETEQKCATGVRYQHSSHWRGIRDQET